MGSDRAPAAVQPYRCDGGGTSKHPGRLLDKWKNVLRFARLERSLRLDSECSVYEVG